jgi:hypothetical protein
VVHAEVDHGRCRLDLPPVEVDEIGDALEGEEGDASRKQPGWQVDRALDAEEVKRVVEGPPEEVEILVEDEREEVRDDAEGECDLRRSRAGPGGDHAADDLIEGNGEEEDEDDRPGP